VPDTHADFDALLNGLADLAPLSPNDAHATSLEAHGEGWLADNVRALSAIAEHGASDDDPLPGAIGPYTPLERIGRGGMGDVYLANQEAPLRRLVALKVIRPGMDSQRVLARFDAERQALALMDHPGIAKVFDAGAGADGRPWFAMEYVRGTPLTDHCHRHHLAPRECIELLARVCEAVHHAHQRGVIHRDLKPTNLLVEMTLDRANPKVIDFGVAKAMGPELADGLHTELGQLVGTPEYMSPEQAEMTGANVDTRTDIYSLGVVLYELLTGTLPFPSEVLRGGGVGEIHRVLRGTEVPRPSTRAESTGDATAFGRHATTAALVRELRGDPDWITMKAMEKDPARRYASASEFAEDLRRYLRHEPVLAGPPGARYRVGKFVRRHRTGVAVAGLIGISLLGGAIATGWQASRAMRAERQARDEAAVAGAVNAFLTDMLAQANPETNPLGREWQIGEVLDEAAARLPGAFEDQPRVAAAVRRTVGDAYGALARYDDARDQLDAALTGYRDLGDEKEIAATLGRLVSLELGASRPGAATSAAEEQLAVARAKFGEEHAAVVAAMVDLARAAHARGRFVESDSLFDVALRAQEKLPATDPIVRAALLGNHAGVLEQLGKFDAAERLARESLHILQGDRGDGHPLTIRARLNLARLLLEIGNHEEAQRSYHDALTSARRVFGNEHPDVAGALLGLGITVGGLGDVDRAEPLIRESIAIERTVHGDGSRPVAVGLSHLGAMLLSVDRIDEAERAFREALAINASTNDAPETFRNTNNLAAAFRRAGKLAQAETAFRDAAAIGARVFGEESPPMAQLRHNLAKTLSDEGRFDEAGPAFDEAIALAERVLPPDHVTLDVMRGNRGELLLRSGRLRDAEQVLLAAYEGIAEKLGPDHARARTVAGWVAETLARAGRLEESETWSARGEQP